MRARYVANVRVAVGTEVERRYCGAQIVAEGRRRKRGGNGGGAASSFSHGVSPWINFPPGRARSPPRSLRQL